MSLELRRRLMVQAEPKDIIINRKWSDNDAALMDVIYAQKWSKSPKYMTKREAEAVKDIGNVFKGNTTIADLSALQYFTNTSFTKVNQSAFQECASLRKIVFPDQVLRIGGMKNAVGTFYNCTSLSEVKLPKNLQELQGRAFVGCVSLTLVDLPDTIINLYQAFWDSYIEEITIPPLIKTIANATFMGCTKLKTVRLTNATTGDQVNSFRDSTLTKNIYYSGSIQDWYKSMFINNSSMLSYPFVLYVNNEPLPEHITIEDNVTCIRAFYSQKAIKKVTILDNVTNIQQQCFYGATNLQEVSIGSGIKNIPYGMFTGCSSLKTVTLPNSITSLSGENGYGAFQNCSALESSIELPNVTTIGNYAFNNCVKIPSITIGDSLTTINSYTFSNCKSAKIDIGSGLTQIYNYAFLNVGLVIIRAVNPPTIAEDAFKSYTR